MRQDDVLACLLFNIALEKFKRDSGIQTRGTIFFKTVQILAFADDIDLMAHTTLGLKIYGTGNKSREDGLHVQWKGHDIVAGPCNRKLRV